jgi:hypothetical protein
VSAIQGTSNVDTLRKPTEKWNTIDRQNQKMGRWRGATFKEYIRNELACFLSGMSRDMKTKFGFVNVSGNAFSDITDACINADYFAPLTVAVM